jgi:CheY-like chemotaxis protein
MPEGGELCIDVSQAEATEADRFGEIQPGRYVLIAVTDTGTGMAPEVLERAFDPFFTTKGLEGTGLGLAMVQGFCRQSGGDVRVSSETGRGTRFELWLPEDESAPAASAPPPPLAARGQGLRVLLTDDSRDVLVMVEAFLRKDGFTVETANGGGVAMAALGAGRRFDVLVTDYMMAGMTGVELIRRAREVQPGLPALVITGYAEVTEFMTGLPKAALLLKPFQRYDLTAQLCQLVGDQRQPECPDSDPRARLAS